MALIAVSGHPGCRFEEVARLSAQRLGFELLTQSRIRSLAGEEFGADAKIPDKAYPSLVTSILARLATQHHLVFCAVGGELQGSHFPGMLRVHVVAPENVRIGNLMLDRRLDRPAARQLLLELEAADRADRKAKFGKTSATAELFDLVLNAEALTTEQMAELIEAAVAVAGLKERGSAFARRRAAAPVSDAPEAGPFRHRAAGQRHAAAENVRPPQRRDVRQPAGFLPHRLGVRAAQFPDAIRPGRQRARSLHAGFLPARVRSLRGTHHHETIASDAEESQGAAAARTVSRT